MKIKLITILFLSSMSMLMFSGCKSTKKKFSTSYPVSYGSTKINFEVKNPCNINFDMFGNDNVSLPYINEKTFTIAVIPDLQSYTNRKYQNYRHSKYPFNQYEIAIRQMEYIRDNSMKHNGRIGFAIHLGDFVNDHHWFPVQWKMAEEVVNVLDDELPFLAIPGNHDYDRQTRLKTHSYGITGTKLYNKYFGPNSHHFANKEWFGGASENGMNSWIIQELGGQKFLFLGIEVEPVQEVLDWAQSIIDKNPDLPVIVATHAHLSTGSDPKNPAQGRLLKIDYHENGNEVGPDEFHKNFILKNKNIFLVLSGHCFDGQLGENSRIDINDYGYPVYSFMQDYQDRRQLYTALGFEGKPQECGDGWFRLYTFDMEAKTMHIQTYSTEFHKFETDEDSEFFINLDWDWSERFASTK